MDTQSNSASFGKINLPSFLPIRDGKRTKRKRRTKKAIKISGIAVVTIAVIIFGVVLARRMLPEEPKLPEKPGKPIRKPKPMPTVPTPIQAGDKIYTSIPLPHPEQGTAIIAKLKAFQNIYLKFHGPQEINDFFPLYEKEPRGITASINAGDNELSVAGVGINQAFSVELAGGEDVYKSSKKAHADTEHRLFEKVKTPGCEGIEFSIYCGCVHSGYDQSTDSGKIFIDKVKFRSGSQYKHERNKYMIYVVPPDGSRIPEKDFGVLVDKLGTQLSVAVKKFNESEEMNGGDKIEQLIMPLVAGGKNRGPHSKSLVAYHLLKGFSRIKHIFPVQVDLPYASDGGDGGESVYVKAAERVEHEYKLAHSKL